MNTRYTKLKYSKVHLYVHSPMRTIRSRDKDAEFISCISTLYELPVHRTITNIKRMQIVQ